jgi:TRAP-type C4-dicarboxylate transport system substrate-binding protein
VTTAVWNRIPAGLRPALMEAAQEAGARMRGEREASVAAMLKAGLAVVPVDAEAKADWLRLALDMYPTIRGTSVPADAFDEALRLRDVYRARKR